MIKPYVQEEEEMSEENEEYEDFPEDYGMLASVMPPDLDDPTSPLGEGEDTRRETAYRHAQTVRDLRERSSEISMELARSMYEIKAGGLYMYITNEATGEPYATFGDYVAEEVDGGLRRADYYAQMWRWFAVQFGEDFFARVSVVKFHKLKELAGLVTPDNVQGWLDLALNPAVSTTEFKNEVSKAKKQLKEGDDESPPLAPVGAIADPMKTMNFKLTPEQLETVNHALALAQQATGLSIKGEMLEEMAGLYIKLREEADQNKDGEEPLVTKLHALERDHGIRLVAIAPDTCAILHGEAALTDLVAGLSDEDPAPSE
jgi:hypothetical protein